jgi:hypothetical protein
VTGRLSRRQFVAGASMSVGTLLTGCAPLPFQQPPPTAVKVHRIGFLSGSNPTAQASNLDIFRQALGALGYVEGQNLTIEYRWVKGTMLCLPSPRQIWLASPWTSSS